MKKKILLAIVVLLTVALTAGPAYAGRGGNKGGPKGDTTSATLDASCGPCAENSVITFTGEGYDASQGKAILSMDGAWTSVAVSADGTLAFDWAYFESAGTYTVEVYQNGKGKKLSLKSSLTLVVG